MPQIGPVHDKDVPGLLEIYRSCLEIPITFECQLPALKEPAGRIRRISGEYPYLVCRSEGELAGYAYTKKSIAKCRTYANAARRKSWLFKKYNQLNRNSSVLPVSLSCLGVTVCCS